ncbi:DUF2155 domain-containing protein [Acetobacter sp.]|uniref:DUF2155 domain-containing protein n=1 Tax=Acetobacter sp. TaxID=440 RepID=UPI0039EC9F69
MSGLDKIFSKVAATLAVCMLGFSPVFAAEPLAPPAMYPADTWQGKGTAVIRVLNRLDSHVETLTLPVGSAQHYEALDITVARCLLHAPTLRRDAAAWLDVQDRHEQGAVFRGWMLAAEPSLGVFESPIYDIRVVTCQGEDVPPALPTLEKPPVPPMPGTTAPASSGDAATPSPPTDVPPQAPAAGDDGAGLTAPE